jgi:putative ABC transport system permease protein
MQTELGKTSKQRRNKLQTALWKDFNREVRRSFSRFISIFSIVFLGVAFFAGIKATAPDMKNSMDLYYDEYNLMDIRVLSTLGITNDDIEAIGKIDGVAKVQPGYFTDAVTTIDSREVVFRIHSIPSESVKDSKKDYTNLYKLTEGRYPENPGECIIEDSNILDTGLSVGDTIKVSSGKLKDIKEDTLAADEFKIVGKAITPYYLSFEKGASEVGSGKVNYFMAVLDKDFKIPVYTEALVTVKNVKALNSYGKEYKNAVAKVVTPLENLGVDRSGIRLDEIKKMAMEELNKNKKEFEEQKKLFDEKIGSAEEELNASEMKLVEGETKLEVEKKNFQATYNEGAKQIAQGERDVAKGEAEYAQGLADYNKAMAEHGEDLKRLDNTTGEINNLNNQAYDQLAQLNKVIQDPNTPEDEKESARVLVGLYGSFLGITDQGVKAVNDLNNFSQGTVKDAKTRLDNGRKELDKAKADLAAAKYKLAKGKREADAKFAAAEEELKTGREQYNEGKAKFESEKAEGEKKLQEGQEKIIRAENEIERLSKPQWYVLDRYSHYSFVDFGKTADRIDAIAKIFPAFFFLVASLVCLTTMTRMVDEQRGIIGTYKALGYGNKSIAMKFILYAASASILGGCLGLALGLKIFPGVIYKSWSMMYTLPKLQTVSQVGLSIASVLIGVLVTTLSVIGACYKELKETPSLLMRPKAPKAGKKILLERISVIWVRLTFSHKVTARNIFRYKKRFFMTIIGIAGCTSLLLAGFGLSNSISQIVNKQFKQIFTYDLNMKYKAQASEIEQNSIKDILDKNSNVKSYLAATQINAKVKSNKEDIAATLIIPEDNARFSEYITLRDRRNHKPIEIPSKGVIINEKLAKELNVKLGDAIEMDNSDGARKKVIISGITENYVFHYVYMSSEYYKEIFRLSPKINSLMIKFKATSAQLESELGSALIKNGAAASVEFYSAASATFEDTVKILNSIVIVIIISAGLLAFVVLYNLTNINIGERIREIATIKVLGFYNKEVSAYVYRENILLSIIGSLVGLIIGIILHRFIMVSIEQDGVMFGNHIEAISFLYSFVITLVFVVLVNIFMYRRLTNIPMVESLKSVE